jgi:phenylpropionate dioxygenase-like ring-hydroxylating dioxygenase large terminal subunit
MSPGSGKRWTDIYPEVGTGPVAIDRLMSPEFYELEREKIFRTCWLCVGEMIDLPEPGDFLVKDLAVCSTSILAVRGHDGTVRAFHNMCSHRGNKLAWDRRGRCSGGTLTCKFHGWCYDAAGRLVAVPGREKFVDLRLEDNGLTPVATEVWENFIFVNLSPRPRWTLREYLGGIVDDLKGFPFARLPHAFGYRIDLKCNWKIAVDAQNEGYHAAFLHKRTIGDIFSSADDPYVDPLDIKIYGLHQRASLPGYPPSPKPVREIANEFGKRWSMSRTDDRLGAPDPHDVRFADYESMPPGLNPTRAANWTFDIYMIFPNFWLGLSNGAYNTHQWWPLGYDRTIQEVNMHQLLPRTAGERFSWEYNKTINRDVWLEDFSTLENTWQVMRSGAKHHFNLQDGEFMVRNFYRAVNEMAEARG